MSVVVPFHCCCLASHWHHYFVMSNINNYHLHSIALSYADVTIWCYVFFSDIILSVFLPLLWSLRVPKYSFFILTLFTSLYNTVDVTSVTHDVFILLTFLTCSCILQLVVVIIGLEFFYLYSLNFFSCR